MWENGTRALGLIYNLPIAPIIRSLYHLLKSKPPLRTYPAIIMTCTLRKRSNMPFFCRGDRAMQEGHS